MNKKINEILTENKDLENINLTAGKNINLKADAGKILLKAPEASVDALTGNLPPLPTTFGGMVFVVYYVFDFK